MLLVIFIALFAALVVTGAIMSLIATAISVLPSIAYFAIFIIVFTVMLLIIGFIKVVMGRIEEPRSQSDVER